MATCIDDSSSLLENQKPSIKDVWKNKSFMLIFWGQLTSLLAGVLMYMTFSYIIYDITRNAALMPLMNIVGTLPVIIVTNFAGVIVDRFDQRKIILITTVLRGIVFIGYLVIFLFKNMLLKQYYLYESSPSGGISVIYVNNYIHFVWPLYTLLFIANMVATFNTIAIIAYCKLVINKKDFLVANSFNSTVQQIASTIAPIAAGALLTFSYLYSFIIGIILMGISTIFGFLLLTQGIEPPEIALKKNVTLKDKASSLMVDLKVGYVATKNEPKIFFILIVYTIANFGFALVNGVYTVVVQGEMALNPTWIGAVSSTMSGIAVLTSLIILRIGKINRKIILVLTILFVESVGMFIFAFNRNPWILLVINSIPFGFVNGSANIPSQTLRQEKIAHNKQGRVYSVAVIFTSLVSLLGFIFVTITANYIQPKIILLLGGGLFFVLGFVSLFVFLSKENLRCSDYSDKDKEIDEKITKDDVLEPIFLTKEKDVSLESSPTTMKEVIPTID